MEHFLRQEISVLTNAAGYANLNGRNAQMGRFPARFPFREQAAGESLYGSAEMVAPEQTA